MAARLGGFNEDLDSEFDASERKGSGPSWRNDPLASDKLGVSSSSSYQGKLPSKQVLVAERDKEEWRSRRFHLLSMDAYSRHKTLINQYLLTVGHGIERIQRSTERDKTDYHVLKEHHKFLWDSDKDSSDTWENRLAKSYYDKLFKEYAISDLSRYKENKIALRWRTEKEVVDGKGQFVCGNKACPLKEDLESWEVNFSYVEHSERKNALVKLRLCPKCSKKLNYHHKKERWNKEKRKRKTLKKQHHKKRRKTDSPSQSSESDEDTRINTKGTSSDDEGHPPGDDDDNDDGGVPTNEKIWKKSAKELVDKTEEEEFDDYFKDMLL